MLTISNISKSFPGVRALDDVSVEFISGEIHALLGENGAGKSTLMKIIGGVYKPDTGKMFFDEKELVLSSYIDALSKEISMVNQELQVLPNFSVAENIMLDKMITFRKTPILNWKEINLVAKKYLDMIDLDVPPTKLIGELSVAQKQMIDIAKSLASKSKILLLDEPTSAISETEAEKLFEILRNLKKKGIIILFVTHKLEEVFKICDKVTVLRDGKKIDTKMINDVEKQDLVKMMIGRKEKIESFRNNNMDKSTLVMEVKNIVKQKKCEDVSFKLYKGEILGFYGLVGSGRTELARLIIGEDKKQSGDIFINGKKIKVRSIADGLYKYRIGYVTENRKEEGLLLNSTILNNIGITIWPKIAGKILRFISIQKERKHAKKMVQQLDIKATSINQLVQKLSGGNQQKVSIAKWLGADCNIIIFDEPTIGVDIGAKEYIHKLIFNLANIEGKSIILISSDMPEIIKLANRIYVFRDKKIVGEIEEVNKDEDSYNIVSKELGNYYT
ncbi:MAG TPA: sugar ABC transporter ATP-binding protein [Actinobacteria bacterium]|nr:sugar ABC transporter ATP-binding protein [Actinomycetota bacterium]